MASTELIKQLREMTGAGIKAAAWLKEQGLAAANKKSGREAKEGVIEAYSHTGGRVAVLVEVNCETDFVARTPEFKAMAHDIALQVVSMNPKYVKREDVPAEVIAEQTEFFKQEAIKEGKKPEIAERIAQGRLNKFYEDNCLMDQIFVKDDKVKISDLLKNSIAKLGENMMVRRFVRYEVGE